MKKRIYDPEQSGKAMNIACFISGSGTNYAAIAAANPHHHYTVFSNRPDCSGLDTAEQNGHAVITLSHIPFLKEARVKYGPGNVPRNCPERVEYERAVSRMLEDTIGGRPDLICLAGYDQWTTDWTVDRYYPRILNIHPGDTTKGYDGLHWVPSAKAILAGDEAIRSTLFIVDKGEDTGPVLAQSRPLDIGATAEKRGLADRLAAVKNWAAGKGIRSYDDFKKQAGEPEQKDMEQVCAALQDELKEKGDWEIYPFGVEAIASGRVEIEDRTLFMDGRRLPAHGYRLDEQRNER